MRAGLALLGIDRFVLAVHDASFPGTADEDVGRGSPYSAGAAALFRLAWACGFDGIQLGPQGKTSRSNPSPYDATMLARSHLSLALGPLVAAEGELGGLLTLEEVARLVRGRPRTWGTRAAHAEAWDRLALAVSWAHRRFRRRPSVFPAVTAEVGRLARQDAERLEADGLFEILAAYHGTDDPTRWARGGAAKLDRHLFAPAAGDRQRARRWRAQLAAAHAARLDRNVFCEALLTLQHRATRARLAALGLRLWADLPVGTATRDRWRYAALFMPGYALGAPPSRTNPEGQAWGYPILEPRLLRAPGGGPGPALRFFDRRIDGLLADFDGLRVDHPHGLVSPWVYRTDGPGAGAAAVRSGARLYSSPDEPDHPRLARYAIARPRDLAPRGQVARHADDWERRLTDAQVSRYAILFDRLVARVRAAGGSSADIAPEVLSTCPYPLARVLARHALGRMRVVSKADPDDPRDPYRTANARPEDWLTLSTHDTPSIWSLTAELAGTPRAATWSRYLASRLAPTPGARPALAASLGVDPRRLPQAMLADLLVGPARKVALFFPDLLGMTARYNVPGVVSARNWNLRVPPSFRGLYRKRRATGAALDPAAAIAAALRARAADAAGDAADLARALDDA